MKHLLLVCPEGASCITAARLVQLRFDLEIANSADEAEELLKARSYDAVLVQQGLPDGDGERLLEQAARLRPGARRLLLPEAPLTNGPLAELLA